MTVPACVEWSCLTVGAIALVAAVMALRAGGWLGWSLGIVAALLALAGLGFAGFGLWGRFVGYPWGFGV